MKLSFKGLTPKHHGAINSARYDKFDTHADTPSSSKMYTDQKTPDPEFASPKSARFPTQGFDTETPRTRAKTKLFKISTHVGTAINIHPALSPKTSTIPTQKPLSFSSRDQLAQSARLSRGGSGSPFFVKEGRSPVVSPGTKSKYQNIWVSKAGKDGSHIAWNDLIWQNEGLKHMRTERTDPSQDFDKLRLLMSQCDNMSQEVVKIEKKFMKDEMKLNEQTDKLEHTSPDQLQAKEFWRTNQAFLSQRAKMKVEIDKFRNQKKEKEEEFKKKKAKAQMFDEEEPVEEVKDPNNESMEQKNKINELILQIPRIKANSVSKKKKIEERIRLKLEIPEFRLEDRTAPVLVPEDTDMRGLEKEYYALVGNDNTVTEDQQGGSHIRRINTGRFPFKKSERIPKLNLQELDNKEYYTATKKVGEIWHKLGSPDPSSNRHFTMRTNFVTGADVKRRQQIYLAQFKPQPVRTERLKDAVGMKEAWSYHHRKTTSQSGLLKSNR